MHDEHLRWSLTSFVELLTVRTTQKAQQNRWMDPSKDWGQNEGSKETREQVNNGKTGNLGLQEGELPKFSLYCLLSRRRASQGQGSLQMSMAVKQQSNTKENLL